MDHTKEQRVISFCTGYGGIERGIERAGVNVRTVAACEIETYAVANLVDKMEKGSLQPFPIWTDLKTFDAKPFRDKVHGIIAGYPCQPFSQAGKRQGVEDPRHLWPYICSHIKTIRPIWCFFENVSGHLTMGFDEVCRSLWDMGYAVEAGVFTAAEVGAPHQRKRLFILAYSDSFGTSRGGSTESGSNARWFPNEEGERDELRGETSGHGGSSRSRDVAELANTNSNAIGQNARGDEESDSVQEQHREEVCGGDATGTGGELADTVREGLQGTQQPGGVKVKEWDRQIESITEHSEVWPSRPGQDQFNWEQPRTLEPGLGRAVDGTAAKLDANRVDRLRLLGNGVVSQTVELAWNTLWGKMNKVLTFSDFFLTLIVLRDNFLLRDQ